MTQQTGAGKRRQGNLNMKIKVKQYDNKIVIRAKLPRGCKIDRGGIGFFSDVEVRGLFRPIQESVKNNSVEFSGPAAVPLSNWLSGPLPAEAFFKMVMQAVDLTSRMDQQHIPLGFVDFDPEHVFINLATTEMHFLFVPMMVDVPYVDIRAFLDQVCQMFIPDSEMAARVRDEFMHRMSQIPILNVDMIDPIRRDAEISQHTQQVCSNLEEFVNQRNPEIVKKVKRLGVARTSPSAFINRGGPQPHPQGQPNGMMPGGPGPNGPMMQPAGMQPMGMQPGGMPMGMPNSGMQVNMQPMPNRMPDNRPGGMPQGNGMPVQGFGQAPRPAGPSMPTLSAEFGETMVIDNALMDSDTMLMDGGMNAMNGMNSMNSMNSMNGMNSGAQDFQQWGLLRRTSTNEQIPVNRSVFRLGRDKKSDYQIRGNTAVGRAHADLVFQNGRGYVVDRNSMNKTYVNGTVLTPNVNFPINSGDRLMLADEEFIFTSS